MYKVMTDFAEINGRYDELQPDDKAADPSNIRDQENAAIAEVSISHDLSNRDLSHRRGFNHIARGLSIVKNVVEHPRRLRWVALMRMSF